jgi:hypothetical protein
VFADLTRLIRLGTEKKVTVRSANIIGIANLETLIISLIKIMKRSQVTQVDLVLTLEGLHS